MIMRNPKSKHPIIRLFETIFLVGIYRHVHDYEKARKLLIVNSITLYAVVIITLISAFTYLSGSHTLGLAEFATALLLVGCIVYVRQFEWRRTPIYIGIGAMTGLFGFLFFSESGSKTGFIWYYTYPLFTLYIMGIRDGIMANVILMVPSFIYLVTMWYDADPLYSRDFIVRFIPSIIFVFIFSYIFETTRLKAFHKLQENQGELVKTIGELQRKEGELKKAHDNLETQVAERTTALRRSNKELNIEIEERRRSQEQQKRLENQLLQAKKMQAIGTLAGGVAHDLNNILSGITSYPELMLMNLPKRSSLRAPLKTIQTSGEKAAAIVQDLLTLSRRGAATFCPVDLRFVVTEYLKSPELKKMLSFHPGVTVKTRFESPPFIISGSKVHLSKTIMNLVTNAAEAMPKGGPIGVELHGTYIDCEHQISDKLAPGRYVQLIVSDSGKGIDPLVIDRIYEPFFTTKKMGRSGTGLGMAVVWGTVEDHQGHIRTLSAPDSGTAFELWFPAIEDAVQQQACAQAEPPRARRESVLVVDDTLEQRDIAKAILNTLGYTVTTVDSGENAIAYLEKKDADLLLLDMAMEPGLNGLETYRAILGFKPDQRAVVVSGFSDSELIQSTLKLGAHCYIKKPYTIDSISRAIRNALDA
jgi:signal transduction histidine kinase/ActR/RegA family two-component response regulator